VPKQVTRSRVPGRSPPGHQPQGPRPEPARLREEPGVPGAVRAQAPRRPQAAARPRPRPRPGRRPARPGQHTGPVEPMCGLPDPGGPGRHRQGPGLSTLEQKTGGKGGKGVAALSLSSRPNHRLGRLLFRKPPLHLPSPLPLEQLDSELGVVGGNASPASSMSMASATTSLGGLHPLFGLLRVLGPADQCFIGPLLQYVDRYTPDRQEVLRVHSTSVYVYPQGATTPARVGGSPAFWSGDEPSRGPEEPVRRSLASNLSSRALDRHHFSACSEPVHEIGPSLHHLPSI